jgi:hypothetical protein
VKRLSGGDCRWFAATHTRRGWLSIEASTPRWGALNARRPGIPAMRE